MKRGKSPKGFVEAGKPIDLDGEWVLTYQVRRGGRWCALPTKITDAANGEFSVDTSSLKPGVSYKFKIDLSARTAQPRVK